MLRGMRALLFSIPLIALFAACDGNDPLTPVRSDADAGTSSSSGGFDAAASSSSGGSSSSSSGDAGGNDAGPSSSGDGGGIDGGAPQFGEECVSPQESDCAAGLLCKRSAKQDKNLCTKACAGDDECPAPSNKCGAGDVCVFPEEG